MAKDSFKKLGIINPEGMDLAALKVLMAQTDAELKELTKRQKTLDKQVRGALWLWWLLPLFGWPIYTAALAKRQQSPKWSKKLIDLKQEIIKKELQNNFNKKCYEKLMLEPETVIVEGE